VDFLFPLALAVAAGLATGFGGLLTLRIGARRDLVFGLTGGLVIGLALLDLVPAALESGSGHRHAGLVFAMVASGFAGYLLLHRLPGAASLGRITLLVHSMMDGLIIGLAFAVSNSTGWLVALAVLAHDMADGANMVGLSLSAAPGRNPWRWLLANALAPVAGLMLGRLVPLEPGAFSLVLAVFAGGFLYIGTVELLPRSAGAERGLHGALACMAGLGAMALVTHLAH